MANGPDSGSSQADVIVVGEGGSALASAIFAAESGARVLLLEKNPHLGGTTRLSIGSITATRTEMRALVIGAFGGRQPS